jgi:radical SAM superfamily enzyme YgiQ (UPF0313 family)
LAYARPCSRCAAAQDLPRLIPRAQTPNVCLQRTSCPRGSARDPLKPLGLLSISALLPEAWERRLVDLNIQPLTLADIAWADVVFASAMLVQKESLRRVVERCKAHGKRVVIGGPSVTTGAEHLPQANHLFLGEAETTVPEFVRDLARGERDSARHGGLVGGPSRYTALATACARRATAPGKHREQHRRFANFVPKMDTACLVEGYKSILRTIYSPGEYYQRALHRLERVPAWAPEPRRRGLASDVMTLSRIVLALGVRDRARGEFWRYLRCALTQHRELLGEAVRLAALGYHCRKLTEGLGKSSRKS